MIVFDRVTQSYRDKTGIRMFLEETSGIVPAGRYALLSPNAAAKTAFVDLICGIRPPQEGRVGRSGLVSWPIGRLQHLRSKLTVGETLAFFSAIYELDDEFVRHEVLSLSNLTQRAGDPILELHPMVVLKMSLAMALLPAFDIYVFDGIVRHPDAAFDRVWYDRLLARTEESVVVMSTSQPKAILDFCDLALVLDHRRLFLTQYLETALQIYPVRVVEEQVLAGEAAADDDEDLCRRSARRSSAPRAPLRSSPGRERRPCRGWRRP